MKFWKLFAVCPFWHRKRKSVHRTPHYPTTPHRAHLTVPILWCCVRAIHGSAGDTRTPKSRVVAVSAPSAPMAPDPHRPTALRPCRTTLPSPTPSRSVASVPRSMATSSCLPQCHPGFTLPGTALELSRKPKTENRSKLQLFCDCGLSQSPQSPIAARKCSENSSFMLCRNREGSAIAKKLQKSRKFCFCNELIVEAEADPFKRLNTQTGQISRWGESRKRRAKPAAERQVARDTATSDKSRF